MNYCQDGLKVYFASKTPQYTSIYGHYELQPNDVNGRPYFKMGSYGFWWDGMNAWYIGHDINKGQSYGVAAYVIANNKDVFCPHQLSEFVWKLSAEDWYWATNDLGVTCK